MAQDAHVCPKCSGTMEQGFVMDHTYGGLIVSHWAAGAPAKSMWKGTRAPSGAMIPIGTFRCPKCGFLESFAAPEFGAS